MTVHEKEDLVPPDTADTRPEARQRPSTVGALLSVSPVALVVLLMVILLRYSALRLNNFDTWFHLVLGDRFQGEWSLRHPGGLTPFATSDWVATQWSTQVLASAFQRWFGLPGVAWLFGALYLAWLLTVYVTCRRFGRALPASVATAMVVVAAAPQISARPQIVSLILLAVTVATWLRTIEDTRPRWWLVALTWGWATAHGLWSAGVLLGFVCCVGLVLDRRVGVRRAAALFAVPVASLVAAALTPVGPRLLTSQFAISARSSMISEWGPTSFRTVPALVAAAMIAWVIVLWSRNGQVSWSLLLLLLLAGGWAMTVSRMVALAAVVAAPLVVQALEHRMPALGTLGGRRRFESGALAVAAAGYLVVLGLAVPHTAAVPSGTPTALVPRLEALPADSTVLVSDGVGSWVEWAVPDVHPVIDGMLDAYPVDYIRDFMEFKQLEPGWQDFVTRSRAKVAILEADSPSAGALQDQLDWKVVQKDRDWVYLVAPAAL